MKKKITNMIVKSLCVTTLFTTSVSIIPVFAAENSAINVENADVKVTTVKKGNAYIPKGTVVEVELTKTISSKKIKKGASVPLKLRNNLIINDVVIALAGTKVEGIVSERKKAGGFGRGGKLEIKINSFKTINGVEVPLDFTEMTKGKKDSGGIAVGIAVSVVGGFLMKGKNVTLEEGTKFDAEVSADTDLNVTFEELHNMIRV